MFEAEKAMGSMPKDVSVQRGIGYDIESLDGQGDLYFIEVKGRIDGADSVTLTINEVNNRPQLAPPFPVGPGDSDRGSGCSAGVCEWHRLGRAGLW